MRIAIACRVALTRSDNLRNSLARSQFNLKYIYLSFCLSPLAISPNFLTLRFPHMYYYMHYAYVSGRAPMHRYVLTTVIQRYISQICICLRTVNIRGGGEPKENAEISIF